MRKYKRGGLIHGCGGSGSIRLPEYNVWGHMIDRCENPKNDRFSSYGGRGITVCVRWRDSFTDFLSDMGKRPSIRHSLDRIDVNSGYFLENCRWATNEEQFYNQRRTVFIEHEGVKKNLLEWSRILGVKKDTIYCRKKRGWNPEKILFGGRVGR